MLDRDIEGNGIADYCREKSIAMLAYSPLANGLLTGKIRPDRQFGAGDLRKNNPRFSRENLDRVDAQLNQIRTIAERHHAAVAQIVIAWTFQKPAITCVLCGARNPQQAAENAQAGSIALADDEIALMDRIFP